MRKELTCINCPMGCQLVVELEGQEILSVTGNTCPRGDVYARNEVVHPVRMITTSLVVDGGDLPMVSCKTSRPIGKERIFDLMNALQGVRVSAPVQIGDILVADAAGTGADLIATRAIQKK